jgi:hypothetical protein
LDTARLAALGTAAQALGQRCCCYVINEWVASEAERFETARVNFCFAEPTIVATITVIVVTVVA